MRSALLFALSMAYGCGGSSDGDDPCASEPVRYASDLRPRVLEPYCLDCHDSSKVGAARQGAPESLSFDRWAMTEPFVQAVANAITSGTMPPPSAPGGRPGPAARELSDRWRRCGFLQ